VRSFRFRSLSAHEGRGELQPRWYRFQVKSQCGFFEMGNS
jgi:hypothetical protein